MEKIIKIIALIQARSSSTRLPNKVLARVLDEYMIIHQLKRISKSKRIDRIILATSEKTSDDLLSSIVGQNNFEIFRGDEENVLKRFFDCSKWLELESSDIVVRLTGDCPLHYHKIIDESIDFFIDSNCDYLANCIEPMYPDGFDVEVFNSKSLNLAYKNATSKYQKEHVTTYMRDSPIINSKNIKQKSIHADYRLTLDTIEDLQVIENIFNHFENTYFSFEEIIEYIDKNPTLLEINSHMSRGFVQK